MNTNRALSRGDRIAIGFFIVAGASIAISTIVRAVGRIVEVLTHPLVTVKATFAGTTLPAPIGPDGAEVNVELDSAYLTSELPYASTAAIVIQQVLLAVCITTVVVCLSVLSIRVMRGTVFGKANTTLVGLAGSAALLASASYPFFGNMAANGAFALISDRTFDNVVIALEPMPFFLMAFAIALVVSAFTVGARMQRDTEGLV